MPALRHDDIAQAIRLIAEVRAMIATPCEAARHLSNRLCALTHSMHGCLGERRSTGGMGSAQFVPLASCGIDQALTLARVAPLMAHPLIVFPNTDLVLADPAPVVTASASSHPPCVLSGVQAELHHEFSLALGGGDRLISKSIHLGKPSQVGWMWFARGHGDGPFAPREVLLVDLIAQQISTWFWPAMRRPLMLAQSFG